MVFCCLSLCLSVCLSVCLIAVCMCVFGVCVYECMHAGVCVIAFGFMHAILYVRACIDVSMYAHVCVDLCVFVCMDSV